MAMLLKNHSRNLVIFLFLIDYTVPPIFAHEKDENSVVNPRGVKMDGHEDERIQLDAKPREPALWSLIHPAGKTQPSGPNSSTVSREAMDDILVPMSEVTSKRLNAIEWSQNESAARLGETRPVLASVQINSAQCGVKNGRSPYQERLTGSQPTRVGEFPWMAALLTYGQLFCGGSLIDDVHILTGAHCLDTNPAEFTVRLGEYNLKTDGETSTVERRVLKSVRHENYNPNDPAVQNDIAILTLDAPVKFTKTIKPVCLPSGSELYTGKTATMIGWGSWKNNGPAKDLLQAITVPIVSNAECAKKYGGHRVFASSLCAGSNGKNSCSGDSGGPLVVNDGRWTQVGIISWGIDCGDDNPTIHARVTEFMPWIRAHLN